MNTSELSLYTWDFSLEDHPTYFEISAYGRSESEARAILTNTIKTTMAKAKADLKALGKEQMELHGLPYTEEISAQLKRISDQRKQICGSIGYLFQDPYSPNNILDFSLETETSCGQTIEEILNDEPSNVVPFNTVMIVNTQSM